MNRLTRMSFKKKVKIKMRLLCLFKGLNFQSHHIIFIYQKAIKKRKKSRITILMSKD